MVVGGIETEVGGQVWLLLVVANDMNLGTINTRKEIASRLAVTAD